MALEQAQLDYIKTQNEKDAALRAGKPVEPAKPVQAAAAVVDNDDDDVDDDEHPAPGKPGHAPDPGRSARRRENRLRESAAEERGRRLALEELVAQGIIPSTVEKPKEKEVAKDDPEPQRKDFPDDAAYNRALGRWDARQETAKALGERDKQADEERKNERLREQIREARSKAEEDHKLIPDWENLQKKAKEMEDDGTLPTLEGHDALFIRLAKSDVQAFLYAHFIEHPKDLQKLIDLDTAETRVEFFELISRLEGRVEKMYSTEQQQNVSDKKDKPKPETAAERDAKKPKPSEAGSPRGGSAPVTTIKPYLDDGRTINPAWKAAQNEREQLRR